MGKDGRKLLLVYVLLGIIIAALMITLVLFPAKKKEPETVSGTAVSEEEKDKEKPAVPEKTVKGRLIIVIDDVGYNLFQLDPFLKLPFKITFAILPGLPYTGQAAKLIHEAGKEYILHQPMDSVDGRDTGPGAIHSGMSFEEVSAVLDKNLSDLPYAVGVNNHMGSAGTADEDLMVSLFKVLKRRKLFFLDSRTTSKSVVRKAAAETGLPFAERSIFLDNNKEKESIKNSVEKGVEVSEKKGHAVMIGHIWSSELAEVLLELYPALLEDNYTLNNLTELFMGYKDDEDTWY